jgi:mRNA deadenylase 3'-5' endonuclease subunit Ccr4
LNIYSLEEKLKNFPPLIERKWNKICSESEQENKEIIRIMQWNILAKALCNREEFCIAPAECYNWEDYRKWRTIQEITRHNSDIICLEETDVYEEIKPYLHDLGLIFIF